MREDRRFQKEKKLKGEQKQLLTMAAIPLIVIILMIIIVIADHGDQAGADEVPTTVESLNEMEPTGDVDNSDGAVPEESTEAEVTEPETEPETEPSDPFATEQLQRDPIPEITDLMRSYFNARATADAETMNSIYGVTDVSAEDLESQRTRMLNNSRYVAGFDNVVTYVMDGPSTNSWLVYALADISFHAVNTKAPMIMWCYVTRDGEGAYHISDSATLSENVLNFIENANHSEAVRKLASDVNMRLRNALNEDEELNSVYGVLRDGSPVWEDGSEEPVVVIGGEDGTSEIEVDTAEGETVAAETEGETVVAETEAETVAAETEAETTAAETEGI